MACSFTDHRPPRELWPDRIYSLPELRYPPQLNLATELVDAHVAGGRGDTTAIVYRDRRISYAELQAWVNRIGNGMLERGVKPGARVLLRMPNRPEFAATWLAVQKIGAVGVATMPMLRARELTYILRDSEAVLAVVAADLLDGMQSAVEAAAMPPAIVVTPGEEGETPRLADGQITLEALTDSADANLAAHATGQDDLALIAYTSGSTGQPKGACHAPIDVLSSADSYARRVLAADAPDVFGGHPTLAFAYGLGMGLVFPFRVGASTVLLDRFTPEALLESAARAEVSLLYCGATSYKLLLQIEALESYDLHALRLCVSAGEPLPRPVRDEWLRRTGVDVLDSLGTTEMFHVFVCSPPGAVRPGATGKAVPGYEVRVVDETMAEVPRGTPGLLAVRGPTGCRYWRKPERQREYVRDGWNLPNDICVQDQDGYIYYQCRNDDMIITAGYNVAGPEVEAVLLEHPAVLEAAVVATPDDVKGSVPKAFVVLRPGVQGSPELVAALQSLARQELAPFKYPRQVVFVESLPKTETGKIRRAALRRQEQATRDSAR